MKPEYGEVWRNIDTGQHFIIKFRLFFNIAYYPVAENRSGVPRYTHYKTFAKHFERVTPGQTLETRGCKDERT